MLYTIRAIYVLLSINHTQPDLHKEVDEGRHPLPLPSPDTSMLTTNVRCDDSGVCDRFLGESGPFTHPFRHGWLPTCHSHTGCHHFSVLQTRPRYPNPAQWRTTVYCRDNQRLSDLDTTTKAKYTLITPPSQHNTQPHLVNSILYINQDHSAATRDSQPNSDLADSMSLRTAASTTQQRATQDSRPAAISGPAVSV